MNTTVLTLDDKRAEAPSLSGGKGAPLAQMTRAGIRVPSGFVVTTPAFATLRETLEPRLAKLARRKRVSMTHLDTAGRDLQQLIETQGLPQQTVRQIRQAYTALDKGPVSVRSSSTAEDLAQASFAGQYDTYLNVEGAAQLLRRILAVWASLYSPHALAYRRRYNIPHQQAAMAVVIQRQITPRAAGVLFTMNPLDGSPQYVATASLGLGEGVVAGGVAADRFVLKAGTGQVLDSQIATAKKQVVAASQGGVEITPAESRRRNKPALTPRQLRQLAKTGKTLSQLFGRPLDIEFAQTPSTLFILQARPLTGIEPASEPDQPWEEAVDQSYTWDLRSNAGRPSYRLEQDYWVEMMRQLRLCYQETGADMGARHIYRIVNGHLYARANPASPAALKRRRTRHNAAVDAGTKDGQTYFDTVLRPLIEERLAQLKNQRRAITTPADWVAYIQASMQTCSYVMSNLHWRQTRYGSRVNWLEQYHEITGRPKAEARIFEQAVPSTMTRLVSRLRDLARLVQSDPELAALFARRAFDQLADLNGKNTAARSFAQAFKRLLKYHGLRNGRGFGSSSDFTTPTWRMDPSIPLGMIATYAEQGLDKLDRHDQRALEQRQQLARRIRTQLRREPDRLRAFNHQLQLAQTRVRWLEDHNYWMEQCTYGTMRQTLWEAGQYLVKEGLIEEADDIFHLSMRDLTRWGRNRGPADLRPLVAQRQQDRDQRGNLRPPRRLGAAPQAENNKTEDKPEVGLNGTTIKGEAAATGRVRGPAVVIKPNLPAPQLFPGDILVADNVGPEWTPLFALIGGLVLDQGSLSQHAAIVAREYRIPAVMQCRDATQTLRDGQQILVDGDRGLVQFER